MLSIGCHFKTLTADSRTLISVFHKNVLLWNLIHNAKCHHLVCKKTVSSTRLLQPCKKLRVLDGHVCLRGYVSKLRVLGIETSCDDTGAAVVDEDGNVLGEALHNQTSVHLQTGGIKPDVARDLHKENIELIVDKAMDEACVTYKEIDAIAVTVEPGMMLSLFIGLSHAKNLVLQHGKPLIPIHHMQAHALTIRMIERIDFPFLVLLISGGHCLLAVAKAVDDFLLLGSGMDVSPGDAIDKTGRELGLKNLPEFKTMSGGRAIEILAKAGDPKAFPHTSFLGKFLNCDFSFSGMQCQMRRIIAEERNRLGIKEYEVPSSVADICASFQYFIAHHLAKRLQRGFIYCDQNQLLPSQKTLVVSGGVASNMFIREALQTMCTAYDCRVIGPPPELCTDNGIMVAWNGIEKLKLGIGIAEDINAVDITRRSPIGVSLREEIEKSHIVKMLRIKVL